MTTTTDKRLSERIIGETEQAELCTLIFDSVETSVDYIDGDPIAVLSDVKAAADAVLAAGYHKRMPPASDDASIRSRLREIILGWSDVEESDLAPLVEDLMREVIEPLRGRSSAPSRPKETPWDGGAS